MMKIQTHSVGTEIGGRKYKQETFLKWGLNNDLESVEHIEKE